MCRQHDQRQVLAPAETRFVSTGIMVRRLQALKPALADTLEDIDFKRWALSIKATERKDALFAVKRTICSDTFWEDLGTFEAVTAKIHSFLLLVNGDQPCTGKIYHK